MSELQSWPWWPGSIWCEEEREEIWVLGFGLGKEEREREKRDGQKKMEKTKEKAKPVATGTHSPLIGIQRPKSSRIF